MSHDAKYSLKVTKIGFTAHKVKPCGFRLQLHLEPHKHAMSAARGARPVSVSVSSKSEMVGCLAPSPESSPRDGAQSATATSSSRALVKSDTCAHVLEIGS